MVFVIWARRIRPLRKIAQTLKLIFSGYISLISVILLSKHMFLSMLNRSERLKNTWNWYLKFSFFPPYKSYNFFQLTLRWIWPYSTTKIVFNCEIKISCRCRTKFATKLFLFDQIWLINKTFRAHFVCWSPTGPQLVWLSCKICW